MSSVEQKAFVCRRVIVESNDCVSVNTIVLISAFECCHPLVKVGASQKDNDLITTLISQPGSVQSRLTAGRNELVDGGCSGLEMVFRL